MIKLNPQATIEKYLKDNYEISSALREKYSDMLMSRAVRFYLENEIGNDVVDEDMQPFCKVCGDDLPYNTEKGYMCEGGEKPHKAVVRYDNLDHSIKHEQEYQKSI
jgi:hypothetical protein